MAASDRDDIPLVRFGGDGSSVKMDFRETVEHLAAERDRSTNRVYVILLVAVATACAALPIIQIDVGFRARGSIRPMVETHRVRSMRDGEVLAVTARRGEHISKGDPLLILDGRVDSAKVGVLAADIALIEAQIADLEILIESGGNPFPGSLRTSRYELARDLLREELKLLAHSINGHRSVFERDSALHDMGLVPEALLDSGRSRLFELEAEATLTKGRSIATWTRDLESARHDIEVRRVEAAQAAIAVERSILRAPVAGTVEELISVSAGSIISPGTDVAVISPFAPIFAEIWIPPADMGLIREGTATRLEVDGLLGRQSGFLLGVVTSISEDHFVVENNSFFRVEAKLQRDPLKQSAGWPTLHKGMTVTAHFILARRSLWQLLFDEIDDWISVSS